jgi:hypothetical protein
VSQGSEAIEEAWGEVLEAWDSEDAHKRFIAVCDVLGRLDEAGSRYRAIQEAEPEKSADAERRIDQIVARALATLHAGRSEPGARGPRRWLLFAAVLFFVAIVGATVWMVTGGLAAPLGP